jgi:hypothetical protein
MQQVHEVRRIEKFNKRTKASLTRSWKVFSLSRITFRSFEASSTCSLSRLFSSKTSSRQGVPFWRFERPPLSSSIPVAGAGDAGELAPAKLTAACSAERSRRRFSEFLVPRRALLIFSSTSSITEVLLVGRHDERSKKKEPKNWTLGFQKCFPLVVSNRDFLDDV